MGQVSDPHRGLTAHDVALLHRYATRCSECDDPWTLPHTRPRLCHYCAVGRMWRTPVVTEVEIENSQRGFPWAHD